MKDFCSPNDFVPLKKHLFFEKNTLFREKEGVTKHHLRVLMSNSPNIAMSVLKQDFHEQKFVVEKSAKRMQPVFENKKNDVIKEFP